MAYKFKNYTRNPMKHKFTGEFNFERETYEYTLYVPDFDADLRNEISDYFGNRMQNGSPCLGVTKADFEEYIDNGYVSAYIIVNQKGNDEKASGTIQVTDHCFDSANQSFSNAYAWISDLCKIEGPSKVKSKAVGALIYFMEQLTVQNLEKPDIYLFVDSKDINNKLGLMKSYNEKYGFTDNSEANDKMCPNNTAGDTLITMKKPNLVADTSKIDFAFLRRRNGGSTRCKRRNKRKTKKRRTRRYKK